MTPTSTISYNCSISSIVNFSSDAPYSRSNSTKST